MTGLPDFRTSELQTFRTSSRPSELLQDLRDFRTS
jgi:hypothetical protein